MKSTKDDLAETMRDVGPYLGLGTALAATLLLFVLVGDWIDTKFNQKPIFTILLSFLGFAAGLYNFLRTVKHLEKKNQKKNEH